MSRHQRIIVQDRSGSMIRIKDDAEGGLKAFLDGQRGLEGEILVSLHQFDDHYETVYEDVPLAEVADYQLVPRGGTALRDAIGRTITHHKAKLQEMSEQERPDSVTLVIVTDGQENASREWGQDQVKELLQKIQREVKTTKTAREQIHKRGWTVYYIGANQDAVEVAIALGVNAGTSLTYDSNQMGTQAAYAAVGQSVSRMSMGAPAAFTDEERASTRTV